MKNIIIYSFLFISLSSMAQEIYVSNQSKLSLKHPAFFPGFGNSKDVLLISGPNYKGLSLFNIPSKTEVVITDVLGAGNQPVMEPSGNIRYHEIQFLKRKKHRTEMTYHTGIQSTGKINLETIIQVKIDGKQLKIYQNNKLESTIQPFGKTNYLWASVSPNQEMLLFTVAGKGTYVTDLSGNIIQEIGYLNAPQWLKSHWVVGMNDKDNGEQVISSVIEAVHLKSLKRVTLTSATNVIAMYPKIAPTFDRLTFHTPEGEIYIMDIAVEE